MKLLEKSHIKIHPRAIEAMGANLVTNDNVAILELVKNSYDAFAYKVKVSFGVNNTSITILDDGLGMDKQTIENDWATISTTCKVNQKEVYRDGKTRIVSGNKGLGRLSASRLGNKLTLITKKRNQPIYQTTFVWNDFYEKLSTDECLFEIYELESDDDIKDCGTKLIIEGLNSEWDNAKLEDLKIELQRLLHPFKENDFKIIFNNENEPLNLFNFQDGGDEIEISPLINDPVYKIYGYVDKHQDVYYTYEEIENYNEVQSRKTTIKSDVITWEEIKEKCDSLLSDNLIYFDDVNCGPFDFEIRVWEMSNDYLSTISEKYGLKSRIIVRKVINNLKGISVYRDGVLVLPKSETSRDWLGLDKRRISQIGRRLSTTQIIGQINISLENNPKLIDTTSRESFVANEEYSNFYVICVAGIIEKLQKLRNNSKVEENKKVAVKDLFQNASPDRLRQAVEEAVKKNKSAAEVQKVVNEYSDNLEKNLEELKERVEYFAQLASAGTFSKLIIHEIKNATNPILRFNKSVFSTFKPLPERIKRDYDLSEASCKRLLDLSDAFSPLSRVTFKKEKHSCNLFSEVNNVGLLMESVLSDNEITLKNEVDPEITIGLHPGEIQTILINLIDNAIYWINKRNYNKKIIRIYNKSINDREIAVNVSDTGTGVDEILGEKIFAPGVTGKLHGFGMGLVVANEIIASHGGYFKNIQPGELDNGATFEFSVPKEKK